jgi:F-type H+-transporting ATPase subunit b
MLDINPGLIIWTIVTFLLLVTVLRMYAWKPLLKALHDREEHVRTSLEKAEHAQAEAERILAENKKQLANAEVEAQRILGEGRALGEKLKSEMLEETNRQSRKLVDQAKLEIEREKDAALEALRGEVASLAIGAAGKILDETLDEAKHRKIVDAYLKELPKN